MKLTDKEILDFVKENITIAKGMTGHIEIKGVHCSIRGDVGDAVELMPEDTDWMGVQW